MSKYTELLKDPRWQRLRLRVFERDNWTCTHCDATTRTLHVHHTFYTWGWSPWEYHIDSLLTLCEVCHGRTVTEPDLILRWHDGHRSPEEDAAFYRAAADYPLYACSADDPDVVRSVAKCQLAREMVWQRVRRRIEATE